MRPVILVGVCGHLMLSNMADAPPVKRASGVQAMKWISCCHCDRKKVCYPDCVTPGHPRKGFAREG